MKDLLKNGVLMLFVIGLLYIIFLRECKHPEPCLAEGEMIIKQSTWDSIKALADKLPIVKVDTFYLPGDTIKVPADPLPVPKPDLKDSTIKHYDDHFQRKDINVWYSFDMRGELLNRTWWYIPTVTLVKKDSIVFVPRIVPQPYPVSKSGLYLSGIVGGNTSSFLFGGGIDYINKKDHLYGYIFQRYGDLNFHSIRIGGKIKF